MSISWVDMSVWMTSMNYGATTCHVLPEEQLVIWADVAGSLLLLGALGAGLGAWRCVRPALFDFLFGVG
jgi:hypothetical protein